MASMLESHLNAVEAVLLAESQIAFNAGHPNLRGGPREWFVTDFLIDHLPTTLEIGQGEIINPNSPPHPGRDSYRPQVDVVLYRRDLPKIAFGGGNTAFLQEGVMATIEVKTIVDGDAVRQACNASVKHKALKYTDPGVSGLVIGDRYPPFIMSYLVAYNGPEDLHTAVDWIVQARQESKVSDDQMIEMICILGRGCLWRLDSALFLQGKHDPEKHRWAFVNQKEKNLLLLFLHMLSWMGHPPIPPKVMAYANGAQLHNVHVF